MKCRNCEKYAICRATVNMRSYRGHCTPIPKKRYVIVIHPTARSVLLAHNDGEEMPLETLQETVGGPIEVVPTHLEAAWAREAVDSIILVVNEEGRLQGKAHNPAASALTPAFPDIVGTAVLLVAKGEEMMGFADKNVALDLCKEWDL